MNGDQWLRGLDIEVNLIGQTTNGKNVGMEGVMRSFYNHEFLLYCYLLR